MKPHIHRPHTPIRELLAELRLVPVVTIHSVEEALAVCRALQAGGINSAEITLRTSQAWDAIAAVKTTLPDFRVGAGTVKTPAQIEELARLQVDFAVSPGLTRGLSESAEECGVAFLPGVATASEILGGLELGRDCFKLFPAAAVGGITLLKSLAAPFDEVVFCPTGGIGPDNYREYLSLPNVVSVGGSWMVAPALIAEQQWSTIERLSREAVSGID